MHNCAVILERDTDFGTINVVEPTSEETRNVESLLSQRVSEEQIRHLALWQQKQLLDVLDKLI